MSKKINLGTINENAMIHFSSYHYAYQTLKALRTEYRANLDLLEKEEEKLLENRKKDIEAGLPEEETVRKWSTEEVHKKMRALKFQFDKDCEPLNEQKKYALSILDERLYYSYALCMQKGSLSATGTYTIKRKKSTEEYKIEKSYKAIIRDFLNEIGCKGQDNDTALEKFAQVMSIRTSGMIKCSKGEDYVKVKSANQFKELFMLAFLQYVIVEKGVVTINEDQSLSMTVYDAE